MENIKAILIPLYNIPQRYKGIILLNLSLLPWKLTSIVSIPR